MVVRQARQAALPESQRRLAGGRRLLQANGRLQPGEPAGSTSTSGAAGLQERPVTGARGSGSGSPRLVAAVGAL